MGLACLLAWQLRNEGQEQETDQRNSSVNSAPNSSFQTQQQQQSQPQQQTQQTQLPTYQESQNQTTNPSQTQQMQNIQQIQLPINQQQLQSPNAANGSLTQTHHYQQPSIQAHFHSGQLLNNNCLSSSNQPITMAVKQQQFQPNTNANIFFKNQNIHPSQMPGVYIQQLPAIPPRYTQANGFS